MIHDGASGQQQPDFGPAPRDAAVAQFRQADLTLPELWTYYYGIGGNADEVVLDAYLNDMLELPPLQATLLHTAIQEMLAEDQ